MLQLDSVRLGLALALLTLLFGIVMGIVFGINEDGVKDYINAGITANPDNHDDKSADKIWRYAQRSHFHATGIGAFTLGLIVLVSLTGMKKRLKQLNATLIGLGGLYALSWFSTFLWAPSMGRDAAHHALVTELLVYVGTGGLLLGLAMLSANLFLKVGNVRTVETMNQSKPAKALKGVRA